MTETNQELGVDLLTPQQLADEWQLKRKTLDNWRSQKVGPPYLKINGVVRYSRRAATKWLNAQEYIGGALR